MAKAYYTGDDVRARYYAREREQQNDQANRLFGGEARRKASPEIQRYAKAQIDPIRENSDYVTVAASLFMFCLSAVNSGVTAGLISGTLTAVVTHFALPSMLDMAQDYIEQSAVVTVKAVY